MAVIGARLVVLVVVSTLFEPVNERLHKFYHALHCNEVIRSEFTTESK